MSEDLSKFVENLDALIFDAGLNGKSFAEKVGICSSTFYNIMNMKRQPSVELLVRIADFFACSTDFLLGKEPERTAYNFKPCPPFSERLPQLLAHFKTNKHRLCKEMPVTHSVIYNWQNGKSKLSLEYLCRFASYFRCTADFILGREN